MASWDLAELTIELSLRDEIRLNYDFITVKF